MTMEKEIIEDIDKYIEADDADTSVEAVKKELGFMGKDLDDMISQLDRYLVNPDVKNQIEKIMVDISAVKSKMLALRKGIDVMA